MKSERNERNLAIGPNGAFCRWRDLRVTLQSHQVSIPGRYRSLAVTEGMPQPVPPYPRAHWRSFWVGKKNQPDARSVTLKWLPPIPVNVQGVDDLTTTVRDVGEKPVDPC